MFILLLSLVGPSLPLAGPIPTNCNTPSTFLYAGDRHFDRVRFEESEETNVVNNRELVENGVMCNSPAGLMRQFMELEELMTASRHSFKEA